MSAENESCGSVAFLSTTVMVIYDVFVSGTRVTIMFRVHAPIRLQCRCFKSQPLIVGLFINAIFGVGAAAYNLQKFDSLLERFEAWFNQPFRLRHGAPKAESRWLGDPQWVRRHNGSYRIFVKLETLNHQSSMRPPKPIETVEKNVTVE